MMFQAVSDSSSKTVVTVISRISDRSIQKDACLVVIYGVELGKKYAIDRDYVVIGRSTKTDIHVDQEAVSRNHCKLDVDGEQIMISDLGSTNGTYVNDELVSTRVLRDGDLIKVGRSIFKFLSGSNIESAYHEEIYRLTTIDGLTQVFNKRYFVEALEREMGRAHRYQRDLSLIMFDIDHFKSVNDQYGHLAGDFVLKQLADNVRERIRREDVLTRYGGEEFALVLPETDRKSAMSLAEEIRLKVEQTHMPFEEEFVAVTISLGVATLTPSVQEPYDFIRIADQNLYRAKNDGRNRTVG